MTLEQYNLHGKVALITGGSRGIGKETALAFASLGADVVVASRTLADLEKVAGEIRGMGRKSIAVATHMGKMDDIKNLVAKTLESFEKVDILVNVAGANPSSAPAIDVDERAWDVTMNLNLKGMFFLSQAIARVMKARGGGCIINVSSAAGITPNPVLPVYSISKASVIMATKVMAKEWAKYGIRVNVIAPGVVKTEFSKYLWSTPEITNRIISTIPMARIGELQEVIGTMVYLASDASSYVTGAVISIDGGRTI